jgi:hypothetical protein
VRLALPEVGELCKDVELAFRLPETVRQSPTRPVFYVFGTFLGADGQVLSSTVDYGHVEGSGAEARVVSPSSPCSGIGGTAALPSTRCPAEASLAV